MKIQGLSYRPDKGVFIWDDCKHRPELNGTIAGTQDRLGYIRLQIDGKGVYAHRLAFLYMTGKLPLMDVDHIDRNPTNNRWANLREVTKKQNMQNLNVYNNSPFGVAGVSFRPERNKYKATIVLENKDGTRLYKSKQTETLEEAKDAKRHLVAKYCPELASEWKSRRVLPNWL